MSSFVSPAAAKVSSDASISRSSVPLVQCSPKGVQPMPTIATRSLMPCEAMCRPLRGGPHRAGLPEVVVNVVGGEQLAERHLDAVADLQRVDVDVGELHGVTSTAVEVDDCERDRRAE